MNYDPHRDQQLLFAIAMSTGSVDEGLDAIEKMAVEKGAEISHLDGVRADFADGWFLMRKSVTAEQITLRAEARTEERLTGLLCEIAEILPEEARSYLKI